MRRRHPACSAAGAAYDHDLTASYGLRFRAGAVLLAVDEITGIAPHGEAGPFRRIVLGPRAALDASVLAGYYAGGLDHQRRRSVERPVLERSPPPHEPRLVVLSIPRLQ